MVSDLIGVLCALAAFVLPLGMAWFIVSRPENRRKGARTGAKAQKKSTLL
jgi:hypothetical protein